MRTGSRFFFVRIGSGYSVSGRSDKNNLPGWYKDLAGVQDVYDTRVNKMVEWMDQVEIAITKVMATKVYTSAEFKRERDNFLSLIKNLEKSDTKKWLDEVKETLFKDRAGDERKEELCELPAVSVMVVVRTSKLIRAF